MKITVAFVLASFTLASTAFAAPVQGPTKTKRYYYANTGADVSVNGDSLINLNGDGLGLDLGAILLKRDNPGSLVDGLPVVGPIASAVLPPVASTVAGLPVVGGLVTGLTGTLDGLPVVGPIIKTVGDGLDLGPLFPAPQNALAQTNVAATVDNLAKLTPDQLSAYIQNIQLQEVALQQKQQQAVQAQAQVLQAPQQAVAAAADVPAAKPAADVSAKVNAVLGSDGQWYYPAAAVQNYLDGQAAVQGATDAVASVAATPLSDASVAIGAATDAAPVKPDATSAVPLSAVTGLPPSSVLPINAIDVPTQVPISLASSLASNAAYSALSFASDHKPNIAVVDNAPLPTATIVSGVSGVAPTLPTSANSALPSPQNVKQTAPINALADSDSAPDSDAADPIDADSDEADSDDTESEADPVATDAESADSDTSTEGAEESTTPTPSDSADTHNFAVFTVRHVLAAMPEAPPTSIASELPIATVTSAALGVASTATSAAVSEAPVGPPTPQANVQAPINTSADTKEDLDDCDEDDEEANDSTAPMTNAAFKNAQRDFRLFSGRYQRWRF